jgi:hypothetical protein
MSADLLTSKVAYHTAASGLLDPLDRLRQLGAHVGLERGAVRLLFEDHVRREKRRQAYAFAERYDALLRMQLDVPTGERPRTVQQLVAAGRIVVRGGQYVRP